MACSVDCTPMFHGTACGRDDRKLANAILIAIGIGPGDPVLMHYALLKVADLAREVLSERPQERDPAIDKRGKTNVAGSGRKVQAEALRDLRGHTKKTRKR